MKRNIFTGLFMLGLATSSYAQESNIDTVLRAVSRNNKAIAVHNAEISAETLNLKTQNNLQDPIFNYDFITGSPSTAGNQTEITFTQEFDMPSVYKARSNAVKAFEKFGNSQLALNKQQLLLNAKLICLELIYRTKLKVALGNQEAKYNAILESFEKKLHIGTGNAIDVNKAKVQLIDIRSKFQDNEKEIIRLQSQLQYLNGGNAISFKSLVYPLVALDQGTENLTLNEWKESINALGEAKIAVAKKGALPKFELGYHYQAVLDQNFQGGLIGISIPLWSNRNKIAQAKSSKRADEIKYEEFVTNLKTEEEQAKQTFHLTKDMMEQYKPLLTTDNGAKLLEKAFELGQINVFDYFLETNYYNDLELKYLEIEFNHQQSIAILQRNRL